MAQTALPDSCQAYLNRTLQPTMPFTLGDANDRPQTWQSKVGGNPYLPRNADYPRNTNGEPLTLLAQVNFAEMPPLPDFPSSGLIQFFVDETDYSLGVDYDNYTNTANYRVVYYPEITQDLAQLCDDFAPFQAAANDRVLWGDSGVGNFFITPEDLHQRDFNRVLFTWDCC